MSAGGPHASASRDGNQMESLQEIFRCFICMENLRDARMCPRCSKLCCNPCIRRWLSETRPQCPHCRASLHIHELVNCRWVEEVTQKLDNLQLAQPGKPRTGAEEERETERCETHVKEELSVYCETCKCCICHECALWSPKHTNHVFKPLEEIYHQHCQQIRDNAVLLRRRFMELIGAVQDMERNIDFVRTVKDQKVREIRNSVELIISRLDSQLKTKLMSLVSHKGNVSKKAEELEGIMQSIESTITNGPKSELILHSSKLLAIIQDGIDRSTFTIPPVSADFQSELVPPYDSATFVINDYSRLREAAEPFYSDPLNANGLTWRLKIYPDGNGVVRGTFLSIFLELSGGPVESSKYEYRIEMIYQPANDPSKNMIREFASDFEINECWGYNRFFRIDLLESEGYLDPVRDTIKLKFDVRSPTYFLKCKDQQWYISELEKKSAQQAQTITELSSRVEPLDTDAALNITGNSLVNVESLGSARSSKSRSRDSERSRIQKLQLLDLTDNNDTEETASEPGSDISDNDLLDEDDDDENENEGDEGGNVNVDDSVDYLNVTGISDSFFNNESAGAEAAMNDTQGESRLSGLNQSIEDPTNNESQLELDLAHLLQMHGQTRPPPGLNGDGDHQGPSGTNQPQPANQDNSGKSGAGDS